MGGVELGAHEPVFDITVSAAKKSTFSRLSQNETAKECYQLGFFAPANADAALACLDMMDFEGIEKVRQRVAQNGTLVPAAAQAMAQIQQMGGGHRPAERLEPERTGRCCSRCHDRRRGRWRDQREDSDELSGRTGGRRNEPAGHESCREGDEYQ